MNTVEQECLVREAKMQTGALKTIGQWRNSALVISTLGAAALYAGMSGAEHRLFLGIPGVLLMAAGLAAAESGIEERTKKCGAYVEFAG